MTQLSCFALIHYSPPSSSLRLGLRPSLAPIRIVVASCTYAYHRMFACFDLRITNTMYSSFFDLACFTALVATGLVSSDIYISSILRPGLLLNSLLIGTNR